MKELKDKVKDKLGNVRYKHTLKVVETALLLAKTYHIEKEKVEIAALLHDYAKELSVDEARDLILKWGLSMEDKSIIDIDLMHGELASILAKKDFEIEDIDILNAIRYHTTGREGMSVLEKIIYLADVIEPTRDFGNLDQIRQMAHKDLDKAVLMAMDSTLKYLIESGSLIHIDTINARNYIIIEMSKRLINEKKQKQ